MRAAIVCITCLVLLQVATASADNRVLQDSLKRPGKIRHGQDTGRFIRVNRILIIGNRVTRESIILRELTVKPGDVVYQEELPIILDLDKKKLINTKLFNKVEVRMLEYREDEIDLLVDLDERWYTFPSPIFELADRNFNEWWQNYNHDFNRVNYGLRLYQFNMRGRNETLRLTAQFGFQRRFELTYRFPYIDKKQKQGLILDFDFSESKNVAYQTFDHKLEFLKSDHLLRITRGGGVTYTYRNSFYTSHAISLQYRSTSIRDTVEEINPRYFGEGNDRQQYGILSYQFTSDHRDYIGYPLTGYYLSAGITKTGLTSNDDVNKVDLNGNFATFFNLNRNFYLSNNTVGYWSSRTDVPYANFGALGYRKQFVRGYEVYVIEGPFYMMNKTTLKKRIFSRTYNFNAMPIRQFRYIPLSVFLKIYGDLAYVKNYPDYAINSRLTDKMLTGMGVGIDVVASYDAVFRFEYSFNGEGDSGFFFHIKKEF